jgi:RNA polymerase sigma-70 factor (sigma-E family)
MISKREAPAFEAFVAESSDRLLRTAYLLCGDRGHAEDLVQTALLRTARRWHTARNHPHAYARQILVNLAKDRWRGLSRRLDEVPLTSTTADPPGSTAPATDTALDHNELVTALGRLTDGQRAVVVLRFFDDLSVDDTAAALGCSTGTVKSQTARAIAALRSALTDSQPDREVLHADR